MKTYRLTVQRTIHLIANIYIEGDSEADAAERFQHQLESRECSQIEDGETWGEAFYYQAEKTSPYDSTYTVLDSEPE